MYLHPAASVCQKIFSLFFRHHALPGNLEHGSLILAPNEPKLNPGLQILLVLGNPPIHQPNCANLAHSHLCGHSCIPSRANPIRGLPQILNTLPIYLSQSATPLPHTLSSNPLISVNLPYFHPAIGPCTRGVQRMLTGITRKSSLYIRWASLVHPLYTA